MLIFHLASCITNLRLLFWVTWIGFALFICVQGLAVFITNGVIASSMTMVHVTSMLLLYDFFELVFILTGNHVFEHLLCVRLVFFLQATALIIAFSSPDLALKLGDKFWTPIYALLAKCT